MINGLLNDKNRLIRNFANFTIFAVISFFFINALKYTWNVAFPYCLSDDWRFIKIFLIPYYQGNLTLKDLWLDPVHPEPISSLLFIMNAKIFDLQMNYNAILSIFISLLVFLIILFRLFKAIPNKIDLASKLLIVIILASVFYGFSLTTHYEWHLVSVRFINWLMFVILLLLYDKYLFSSTPGKIAPLIILSLQIFLLVVNFDHSLILIAAIIPYLMISLIANRKQYKLYILLIIINIISIIISKFILFSIISDGSSKNIKFELLIDLVLHPLLIIESMGIAYISSFFNLNVLKRIGFADCGIQVFAVFYILIIVSSLFYYFKKKSLHKSVFPVILIFQSFVFMVSVLLFRYNPLDKMGIYCLTWPRYHINYLFGNIGLLWILIYIIIDNHVFKRKAIMFLIISTFTISIYASNYKRVKVRIKSIEKMTNKIEADILSKNIKLMNQNTIIKARKESLDFLINNELNVFSPKYKHH